MIRKPGLLRTAVVLTTLSVVAAACGGDDGDGDADATSAGSETSAAASETASASASASEPAAGGDIVIGAVSSMSGPATLPGGTEAAQAVFDKVNAEGGINGRMIKFVIGDDQGTPDGAAKAGKKLVDEDQVVALAGGASIIECTVNANLLEEAGVYSVPAVGTATACYDSPNIAPVNTGPHLANLLELLYISNEMGSTSICNIQNNNPGGNDGLEESVRQWQELTGGEFVYEDMSLTPTSNMTPVVLAVRDAGCEIAVFSVFPPAFIAAMNAADEQGISGVTWVTSSTSFSDDVAAALATTQQSIIAASEFEPYVNDTPEVQAFSELMDEAGVPQTAFAIGGYVSASWMVEALKSIDGEITRESVGAALTSNPYETTLVGTPLLFGGESNPIGGPNQALKMVDLTDGAWIPRSDEWFGLPE